MQLLCSLELLIYEQGEVHCLNVPSINDFNISSAVVVECVIRQSVYSMDRYLPYKMTNKHIHGMDMHCPLI